MKINNNGSFTNEYVLKQRKKKENKVSFFTPATNAFLLACLLILILGKTFPIVRVVGNSMSPTYKSGNLLITSKGVDDINRNDIVYFSLSRHISDKELSEKESKHYMIKRVVGIPGDHLICKNGYVYINGVKEIQASPIACDPIGLLESEIILKDNEYFVMGDNRINSFDSRSYGPINKEDMKGVIKYRIFKD